MLRLAASLKFGHATASLVVGKLHAASRRTALAQALVEYGGLQRTIFAVRYLADEAYRRRITRQLNKGESLHAMRRDLHFAHHGHVRRRHHDDQTDQALCLTVVTNAVVLWNTVYLGDALDHLRATGRPVTDDAVAHLSPAQDGHLNPYGCYTFDLDTDLTAARRRPLHQPPASRR